MAVLRNDGLRHIDHDGGVLEIPPLPHRTILLVEVGSTAHGTGLPGGEDHDEMGVVVESPAEVLGTDPNGFRTVMQRTQPEGVRSGPGDTDRTLHSLRRFLRLASSGNPSILMSFWAPVLHATDAGRELQALGGALVGRHVIPRYRGYMQAQAMRLLGLRGGGHGRRGGGGREELIAEHGYDTKYAMHAARLGFQGTELLTTRQLNLPIQGEPAEWLRAVRRGDVGFDEWWQRCLSLDAQLERMASDDAIPETCDRARIDAWSVRAHLGDWRARTDDSPSA
ncbi:MAG TPA: nucleotidyltransferase domain-containing protein [Acidimicrobiales bacterium]